MYLAGIGTILKMSMTTSNGSLTYVISETIKVRKKCRMFHIPAIKLQGKIYF